MCGELIALLSSHQSYGIGNTEKNKTIVLLKW